MSATRKNKTRSNPERSKRGFPDSEFAHKSNMWIEGQNHPAQWGGLEGKKNSSYRKSVFP